MPSRTSADFAWMQLALRLARRGVGSTFPNPPVGAVLVKAGNVLSQGWHRAAGRPHAEIEALAKLPDHALSRGATLYVTLEPCSTHGRTPPCTEAIIRSKIKRVVVGTADPNPLHAGKGLNVLKHAGISVTVGVCEKECRALIKGFAKRITTGLPWVIAKAGQSLDGRLSRPPGEGQWLTSPASRADAMRLRREVDAILVGAETVRRDNPQLLIRPKPRRPQPLRVVWSPSGNVPEHAQIFTDAHAEKTLVIQDRRLKSALKKLARQQGITSVLIEGGGRTLGAAFDEKLVDEVRFYYAPLLCGGPVPSVGGNGVASNEDAVRLSDVAFKKIAGDMVLSAKVRYHP